MPDTPKIHPVILSGGAGTRLWPLSRQQHPKQLHRLISDRTMLQDTALRFDDTDRFEAPMVICNEDHRFSIAEQFREADLSHDRIVLEPAGRNTAPAVALASLMIGSTTPDALILVLPADHRISDEVAFQDAITVGRKCAESGSLVTFGILPDRPETGYGYIEAGEPICEGVLKVTAFTEKPDHNRAVKFLASGNHFWNSGIFLFRADRMLDELRVCAPDVLKACAESVACAHSDLDFVRPGRDAFLQSPSISLDYAVMEHASDVAVVPVAMGWDDVGGWQALWAIGDKDQNGNVTIGEVITHDTSNSYIRSERRLIATAGIEDIVIVETADAILVAHRDAAHKAKDIVARIEAGGGQQHASHTKVNRPWGYYERLDEGDNWAVKQISVKPGASLSLQAHNHRAEHWVVIRGTATVTNGDQVFELKENESTFIPILNRHRLENKTDEPLEIIEVQTGDYLGEDDIIRYDDVYGRVGDGS